MTQGWCQAFKGPTLHYVRGGVTLCGKGNVNANARVVAFDDGTRYCAACREAARGKSLMGRNK